MLVGTPGGFHPLCAPGTELNSIALYHPSRILPLALLAMCQCSTSAPQVAVSLQPGDRLHCVYADDATQLGIRNAAWSPPAAADASSGNSLGNKVASDSDAEKLVAGLAMLGFFDAATAAPMQYAKATLVVELNGREFVRSRLPLHMTTQEDVQQFFNWVAVFRHVYDNTMAFQSSQGIDAHDLKQEQLRLQQNAANHAKDRK